ncbi:nucleoside-specific channel-forming protein Tsx, partial [Salmonella enterica]|nr:nucleoside-specific channel-forming protein Tsx [Salmonella enterica]
GFTNFDFGSDLGKDSHWVDGTGKQVRTSNSIASSHILALNYDHWHYSFVARYFHNGGQWQDGAEIGTPQGPIKSTGWGYYLV